MRKLTSCFLFILIVAFSSSAFGFQLNWGIDPDGSGVETIKENVVEYLDFVGAGWIENTFTSAVGGTFDEVAVFTFNQKDSGPFTQWGGPTNGELTAILEATGTFDTSTGGLTFTGGTADFYWDSVDNFATDTDAASGIYYGSNDGTLIGSFDVTGGDGSVDQDALPNGEIGVELAATFLQDDTWFLSDGSDAADLSNIAWFLGFGTTNATYKEADKYTTELLDELAIEAGGNPTDWTANDADNPPFHFMVGSNGQLRTDVVPEPTSLLLCGMGLIGLAALGRRKFAHKD